MSYASEYISSYLMDILQMTAPEKTIPHLSVGATLSTTQSFFLYTVNILIFLGVLPWYTWSVLLFSIPWAIVDWGVAMFGMLLSFVGLIFVVPAAAQFLTLPIFFLLGIFGEIFLIPLAFFSPLLILSGLAMAFLALMTGQELTQTNYLSWGLF